MPAHLERPASRIPQHDGPIPYDDDVLSTPNVSSEYFSSFLHPYKLVMKYFAFCSLPWPNDMHLYILHLFFLFLVSCFPPYISFFFGKSVLNPYILDLL